MSGRSRFAGFALLLAVGLTAAVSAAQDARQAIDAANASLRTAMIAIEDGIGMITSADGTVASSRYVVVWKAEGGVWKLHRDIWNADK